MITNNKNKETSRPEYYYIKSKTLAKTLGYLLNETFFTMDSDNTPDGKIYSFKNTDRFQEMLSLVMNTRAESKEIQDNNNK